MKKWLFLLIALFVAACQNDGGGGGGNTTVTNGVTTPLTSCIDGTTFCDGRIYSQTPGFMAYPGMYGSAYNYMNQFARGGFCNCPMGTSPIYNSTYGLGCIQTRLLQPFAGYYMYWQIDYSSNWTTGWGYNDPAYYYGYGYNSAPQIPNNYPQYSNIPAGTYPGFGGGSSCSRNLTQSCLLNQGNTCGNGATCRQVISGSNLGVCAN